MRCFLCARAHIKHKDVFLFAEACAPVSEQSMSNAEAEISAKEQHLTFWVGSCSEGVAGLCE